MLLEIVAVGVVAFLLLVTWGLIQARHDRAMTAREQIRASRYTGAQVSSDSGEGDIITTILKIVTENPEIVSKLFGKKEGET